MSARYSNPPNLEFNIIGDAVEEHRIQLEQNLQQTDISLNLSSPRYDHSDIEHPRHISDPHSFSGIASFDRSREAMENPSDGLHRPWSYRATDEDDGYNPYAGETMSTAAHHASALTLSAGLGGRGGRRDISLSGAEYDPDRPVQGIMAGMNRKGGGRSLGHSGKTKQTSQTTVDFDPLVVDDTAELDQLFQTYRSEGVSGLQSPPSSGSASPVPQPTVTSPRPKLSDALHRVTFSPKRPRSAQATPHRTPRSGKRAEPGISATPARERSQQSLSYATIRHSMIDEPTVHVHPPTPSQADGSSKFTKFAKGITAELQAENQVRRGANEKVTNVAQSTMRRRPQTTSRPAQSPFRDGATRASVDPDRSGKHFGSKSFSKVKVHLPDVTGLTSAVGSPTKLATGYFLYDANEDGDVEAQLMATLSAVQSKLVYLEAENSVSRRRVLELERELDECKKEVAKERTRVLEPNGAHYREGANNEAYQDNASSPGHRRMGDASRYREAVEEKKALEALVATLRAHLARLTAELSEHRQLLAELRSLRDRDAFTLQEKSRDIDKLKAEVERLSGEVEVLRGVVEEGLKERREVRERSMGTSNTSEGEDDDQSDDQTDHEHVVSAPQASHPMQAKGAVNSDADSVGSTPQTAATSQATQAANAVGSDVSVNSITSRKVRICIDEEELDRISMEVEERRFERSMSRSVGSTSRHHGSSRHQSPVPSPLVVPGSNMGEPVSTLDGVAQEPHDSHTCTLCHRRRQPQSTSGVTSQVRRLSTARSAELGNEERGEGHNQGTSDAPVAGPSNDKLPPQTVLTRVVRELEDDFTHYKAVYVELADQYKVIDAASNVAKRNVLAQHVHEIVDTLEQKARSPLWLMFQVKLTM
ncbi:hypothetical protein EUX98_g2995 [Antrodiella citrinella]|uniref:Cep57 centrosome microtubule-binding domain-containing protein n=1 Tax=Antrodiella citrinella TaxID=2447956 RepID=A0A4S4MXM5_9APHY|nr:hypothetical protein EUX98_g2995 [Antrodiella citrinella]